LGGQELFYVNPDFVETAHGELGCITCHSGQNVTNKEEAHQGLITQPSAEGGGALCATCHEEQGATFAGSIHYTVQGMREGLEAFTYDGSTMEEGSPYQYAFDDNCSHCHSGCGSCHVSRPQVYTGGLHSEHMFAENPPVEETCYGCHGARVAGEFMGLVGYTSDVHFDAGMTCTDCHDQSNFHGSGEPENNRFEADLPSCSDCHGNVYEDSDVLAHKAHSEDTMNCQVCHGSANNNCYDCHVMMTEDGALASTTGTERIMFKIGLNPDRTEERPYEYISLRHVPTAPDTLAAIDGELPNYDEIPNWKYSSMHNVQRLTMQNESCEACHGNEYLFLGESDLVENDSKANLNLVVRSIPQVDVLREIVQEETSGEESDQEDKESGEAIDAGEVLLEAAKNYFVKVATDNNIMPPADVKAMLDSNPNSIFVLDIRSADDFEAGHIPGAVHSAWAEVGNILDRIPRTKPVVVGCYSGQTAAQTVAVLRMAGFENVKSIQSGISMGWLESAGLPLDETGMNAAADLDSVSSPADGKEEIIWEAAKEFFAAVASGNNIIPGPELHGALESNPNAFYVIDIRSAEDYAEGHIAGAIHSAWAEMGNLLEDLPGAKPIVVGCYSGQTAGQTIGVLRLLGFDAYSVQSGISNGWIGNDGLPLVTE